VRPGERPLVGREEELEALAGVLNAMGGDQGGSVVQIAGEPGIGKSRMLRELAAMARARGHVVLAGRAAEFEGEVAFGVFRDALDDWLLACGAQRRAALAGDQEVELAVVLSAFEGAARRRRDVEQERHRSYRAVRRLLATMAGGSGLVLILDDVQWADPGSVELLCHVLAHPPAGNVLVAVAFRPAQLVWPLQRALASVVREHEAVRMDLAPLSVEQAVELLGADLRGDVSRRVYCESGGNPFFLLQLARAQRLGQSGATARQGVVVPAAVGVALASELSSVSSVAHVLLQGAAVAGDPFDLVQAACAAGVDEASALDRLDTLLAAGLVSATDVAGRFAFRHPIVRGAVYESASSAWRARAHGRLAALLAVAGVEAGVQAPHVERSARKGDRDAVAVLIAAGDASAQRAPAVAARWYAAARRLLTDGPAEEERRIELQVAEATALRGCGELAASQATLDDLLERLPAAHPARVRVVAWCAAVEHLLGRHRHAGARVTVAREAIQDSEAADAVLLEVELAAGCGYENRHDAMHEHAQQALAGATGLGGDRALHVVAAGQVALARYFAGAPTDDAVGRAAAAMDRLEDAELARRLDIGLWVGWTEAVLERHDAAIAHCQRVLDVSRDTGQGATLLVTMTAQAWAQIRAGRLHEAETTLTEAVESGRLSGGVFFAVALGLSAVLATHRGDHQAALAAGEECVRLGRTSDPGLIRGMSGFYLANVLIEVGQPRRARGVLLEMSGGGPELETSRSGHAAAYEVLTRAEVELGRPDAAEFWARRAHAAAHGGALAAEAAFADRAMATVALARGDAQRAAQLAQHAADRAHASNAPVEAARCRVLAGRALADQGARAEAVAVLESAAHELSRVGADGYRADADKQLRRLGRRAARVVAAGNDARPGLDSLTEREREIAILVSRGHSNRAVATAIHLSEKTVERHLSNVFRKLGVTGRSALELLIGADGGRAA